MWVRIVRDSGFTACLVPSVLTDYRINTQESASMNFPQFTRNAELAAARIERGDLPKAPRAVVRRGLAEAYRIAGTKALGLGDRAQAFRLIAKAVSMSPLPSLRQTPGSQGDSCCRMPATRRNAGSAPDGG